MITQSGYQNIPNHSVDFYNIPKCNVEFDKYTEIQKQRAIFVHLGN